MTAAALPTQIKISNDVLFQVIDNEYVLLQTLTQRYFGLDEVAARFWQLFSDGVDIRPAVDKVLAEYEIDRETVEKDLGGLLQRLEKDQLITLEI
ncbi:MAG: PqqD family protein [Mucilaginibacter sp.]